MRILQVSYGNDHYGAAMAARTLHMSLLQQQVSSVMVTAFNRVQTPHTLPYPGLMRLRSFADRFLLALYPEKQAGAWSNNFLPNNWLRQVLQRRDHDLVHLHWTGFGFFPIAFLAEIKVPVVITLHDWWWMTGGCHLPGNCIQFSTHCSQCPQLGYQPLFNLAAIQFIRKSEVLRQKRPWLICPSEYMQQQAGQSALLADMPSRVISPGTDERLFYPRQLSRSQFGLPEGKKLVLFGCSHGIKDPRKGFTALYKALEHLADENLHLVLFGKQDSMLPGGIPYTHLGYINNRELLADLYSIVDVTVVPSTHEPFGLVAAESLLCKTPVVCFAGTGTSGIISHKENGYIARYGDMEDLAEGIRFGLGHRMTAGEEKKLTSAYAARQHIDLYQHILSHA